MRVIGFLSLLFGFIGLTLLDGQTLTHAIMGIIFGAVAIGCGLGAARKDFSKTAYRWEGRMMAALGLVLVVICVVYLPMAYRTQTRFNERSRARQQEKPRSANERSGVDAGSALCFDTFQCWPGATHRDC